MSTYTSAVANSVCVGKSIIVSATDATDGYVEVDFQIDELLTFQVQIVNASGVVVDISDAVITLPDNGVVRITNGASIYTTTATDIIRIIGVREKV